MKHTLLKKSIVATGVTLALLTGCGTAHAKPIKYPLPAPTATCVLAAAPLVENWSRGTCIFKDNALTYKGPNSEKTIELDTKVENPLKIICSDEYTAILTPDRVVISLGGKRLITDQVEVFWTFMERFYPSNMYAIGITEIMAEGIKEASIKAHNLVIQTSNREWTVDLSYPAKWEIINNMGFIPKW
ncbi:hypothetical protein H0O00_05515 [Candidatus Micrarchaeota archaeon]|nr:hypothetical protein [Candidatus Micrarchaeota archaeon]